MRAILLAWALRILCLSKSPVSTTKKGIIVIQIDGVSYESITQAIKRGYCPFFRELQKKGYALNKYFCGIPSITTATEALLMYGNRDDIPGFSWFDRKEGIFIRGGWGSSMRRFEERRFGAISRPLFQNGSCIIGAYSGGATLTNFSAKSLDISSLRASILKFRILLVPFLNPYRFWRMNILIVGYSVLSVLGAIKRRSMHFFKSTMSELLMRIFLTDLASSIAHIELWRDTPALFINFSMFDKVVHEHGTDHPMAYQVVSLTSIYCKKLYESSLKSKRQYEFILYADHGQSDALPFEEVSTLSLVDVVAEAIDDPTRSVLLTFGNDKPIEENLTSNTIFLVPSSSIVNVYFSESLKKPLDRASIEKKYPKLLSSLLTSRGIGWILVRDERRQRLIGKHGSLVFEKGHVVDRRGDPMQGASDEPQTLVSLARFAQYESIGDIVLFGAVIDGKSIAFEDFHGTHGGFTGPMVWPFLMTNSAKLTKILELSNSTEHIFKTIRSLRDY
ncbi:MAG: hypothetical protein AAB961_00555 [Patescibacteria group bacterium]